MNFSENVAYISKPFNCAKISKKIHGNSNFRPWNTSIGIRRSNEVCYEKHLELYSTNVMERSFERYQQLLVAKKCSFAVYRYFTQTRTVENLPRVGRPYDVAFSRPFDLCSYFVDKGGKLKKIHCFWSYNSKVQEFL